MTTLVMETMVAGLREQVARGAYVVPETVVAEAIIERLLARRA